MLDDRSRKPIPMRLLVLLIALAMIGFFGFLTIRVAVEHGVDVFTLAAAFVLALLGFGIVGALLNPPEQR